MNDESNVPAAAGGTDELQFSTVEPATAIAASAPACAGCQRPLTDVYYALADKMICPHCNLAINAPQAGSKFVRVLKATVFGLVAGLLGALVWYAMRKVAHIEIGLIAVLVGFVVGKAVRKGSGGRGGVGYQILAVVLTYSCITANYMPDVFMVLVDKAHRDDVASNSAPDATQKPKPGPMKMVVGLVLTMAVVFAIAAQLPFFGGAQNILGLLIIGFALWEAWKFNRRLVMPITGPYRLESAPGMPAEVAL